MVKFTHLISKGDKNKCHVKFIFGEVFENSIKLLISPLLVMLQTFFFQSARKGKLGTQALKALF